MKDAIRGIANVNTKSGNFNINDENLMTGDITYEELCKIDGISDIALAAKRVASSSAIFKKSESLCALFDVDIKFITYKNIKLLRRFISTRGKIAGARASGVKNRKKQRKLRQAILLARYLGLLPYVKY